MKLKSKNMRTKKKKAERLPFDLSYTQSRELSWLQFNARVLYEAADERVPLYERLRFAAIFTSNLDEFFMVRVGALSSSLSAREPDPTSGWEPAQQLERIMDAAESLCGARDDAVEGIEDGLRAYGFERLRRRGLPKAERLWLDRFFAEEVQPKLAPILLDEARPLPTLAGGAFYILLRVGREEEGRLALVPVPAGLPPFVRLPGEGVRFLLMEQLVRDYAREMFPGTEVSDRAILRLTRSADISLDIDPGDADGGRDRIRQGLARRPSLEAVRLEIQGKCKAPLVKWLCARLGLPKEQAFRQKCPLSLGYAWQLAESMAGYPELFYPPHTPVVPAALSESGSMTALVRERDRLLHYPYESMTPFLRLVREAADDPACTAIQLTVYRAAERSALLSCLIDAARNGKAVTVVFELRARFDEQNNIDWAERLEAAGCRVLYGVKKLKCHAKLCLITRAAHGQTRYLTQIGTGNYNEKTAAQYTDLSLMTADPEIGADAAAIFESLSRGESSPVCTALLAAPAGLKPALLGYIQKEAEKARAGQPCGITFKCNALTDRGMIDAIRQASAAGVPVRLLVRGICCLVPGVEGLTENVTVYSIVGRFLEHARIYAFGAEMETLFLGSADLMTRNLDRRVEVLCPVRDPAVAARVRGILQAQLSDTAKRHVLDRKKGYRPVRPPEGEEVFEAQAFFRSEAEKSAGAARQDALHQPAH